MKHKTLLESIGNTPIIRLDFGTPATILAKLEYLNPGGSIKDRSALYMIEEAEKMGWLKPGGTIIEASSGNQGVAAAMIGAAKGYNVIITTNEKFSKDKLKAIEAYGAEIKICAPTEFIEDAQSYHSLAIRLHKETPNSFMLNQYYNLSNPQAHYTSLGPEIWQQTQGEITHFMAGTGSCGTISGTGKYLKEQNSHIKVIGVDAAYSHRSTHGNPKPYKLEGVGVDYDGPILRAHRSYIDEFFPVHDQEGLDMLKTLAHKHGILVGPSSGAVAYAAYEYSKSLTQDDILVIILADSGRAYLTRDYYRKAAQTDDTVMPATSSPEVIQHLK